MDFTIDDLDDLLEEKTEKKRGHMELDDTFKVRYTDIDSNQHVNNTKYVDWAIETLPEEIVNNYYLDEVKVTFEKECKYGQIVNVYTDIREEESGLLVSIHKIETEDKKELTKLIGCWKRNEQRELE